MSSVKLVDPSGSFPKECPLGFSWTTLLFGFFVPLMRGWWLGMAIALIAPIPTFFLSWFVFPFFANKMYVEHLLKQGYKPYSEQDAQILSLHGINVSTNNAIESNSPKRDYLDQLEKLGELKDKGILTEMEFEEKKKSILGSVANQSVQKSSNQFIPSSNLN